MADHKKNRSRIVIETSSARVNAGRVHSAGSPEPSLAKELWLSA